MFALTKSSNPKKKYMVISDSGKTIHFGAKGYGDFIFYSKNNKKIALNKKRAYIARHSINEDFSNPNTAGFWSRWILWNEPTLKQSIKSTSKKFGLKIVDYSYL